MSNLQNDNEDLVRKENMSKSTVDDIHVVKDDRDAISDIISLSYSAESNTENMIASNCSNCDPENNSGTKTFSNVTTNKIDDDEIHNNLLHNQNREGKSFENATGESTVTNRAEFISKTLGADDVEDETVHCSDSTNANDENTTQTTGSSTEHNNEKDEINYKDQMITRTENRGVRIVNPSVAIRKHKNPNDNQLSDREGIRPRLNDQINYKDQMNTRSENRGPRLVNPSVAIPTNRNCNHNQVLDRDGIRRRLNISELVVHYGTHHNDNINNNNAIMHHNDETSFMNQPVEDSIDKSILPIAAEIAVTTPLGVATPIRNFTKKQIAVMLFYVTLVIAIAVVLTVVFLSKGGVPKPQSPTASPVEKTFEPTSKPQSPTGSPMEPTFTPTFTKKCFVSNNELKMAVNVYLSNDSGIRTKYGNQIGNWCVSNVTNMAGLFATNSAFNGDISSWDVSSVTDMSHMFDGATVFNQDLSRWDVSSVSDMSHMFYNASLFNQDLSSWDVSTVTQMNSMFQYASSFNGNISSWNMSRMTSINGMFSGAITFNQDISSWDVSRVVDMSWMFYDGSSFNQDLSSWDVSSVTNMKVMFKGASDFNQNISSWNVSSVRDMSSMFTYAISFSQPLSSWDVSKVKDMSWMFWSASSFNQDLSSWNVSSVTDMSHMFYHAFNQDLCLWSIELSNDKFVNISGMFSETNCPNTSDPEISDPLCSSLSGPFCYSCPLIC